MCSNQRDKEDDVMILLTIKIYGLVFGKEFLNMSNMGVMLGAMLYGTMLWLAVLWLVLAVLR